MTILNNVAFIINMGLGVYVSIFENDFAQGTFFLALAIINMISLINSNKED